MNEFLQLPAGIRNTIAVLSGTTVVGALSFFDKGLALIVAIGLVILLVAILAFFFIRNTLRKRRESVQIVARERIKPDMDKTGIYGNSIVLRHYIGRVKEFGRLFR